MRGWPPARWNMLTAAVAVAGALFIAATRATPAAPQLAPAPPAVSAEPAPEVGHAAPPFALDAAGGGRVSLAGLRGRVVVVNIWATWCPPCRSEMPAIQATYERRRGDGLEVLAVNQREDAAAVAQFMAERRLTFTALLDPRGEVGQAYRASAIPATFFVGRDGTVRAAYRGPLPRGVLESTVDALLAERAP